MTQRGKTYRWALGVWLVFLAAAVLIGAGREGMLAPTIGEAAAHVVGTLLFVAVMLVIMRVFVGRIRHRCRRGDVWLIGVLWTAMTVTFDFGFFHFVAGKPWSELLADYNILAGRVWVLVLLATLFGPPVIHFLLLGDAAAGDRPV
jgi:hypothetical protein